jgi:hypothetical protein
MSSIYYLVEGGDNAEKLKIELAPDFKLSQTPSSQPSVLVNASK